MRGSFQIARIFGIPVQIHWTFLLLFPALLYLGHRQSWDWDGFLWTVTIFSTLFICVIFHEFGHALTARRFGVQTRDIILSPIGGVARLDRLPDNPWQEFLVAAAGPLVNVVIALLALPYLFSNESTWQHLLQMRYPAGNLFLVELSMLDYFLLGLFLLNATLAIFNLLPAFPMDGGRILRALLSLRLGRIRATRIAVYLGQALAIGLIILGAMQYSPVTAFIGVFVFVTAGNENRIVRFDGLLEKHRVRELLRHSYTRIYHTDTMEQPLEANLQSGEQNFLIFDRWQNLVGVLNEEAVIAAARRKDFGRPVSHYMRSGLVGLLDDESLREALAVMQEKDYSVLPVFQGTKLEGVIDLQAINDFLRQEIKKGRRNIVRRPQKNT